MCAYFLLTNWNHLLSTVFSIIRFCLPTNIKKRRERRMKLKPLQDRILVQRVAEETTTKGGIIIPDTAKEKPAEGKVTAVGNGKVGDDGKRIPLEIKKGDRILFGKYSGTEVKIEGDEYLIMREDDVLGIIQ
jgi:chaperonin GroES